MVKYGKFAKRLCPVISKGWASETEVQGRLDTDTDYFINEYQAPNGGNTVL